MYRCVTWLALQSGKGLPSDSVLTNIAQNARIEFLPKTVGRQIVKCDGQDVTFEIRRPLINQMVSKVSSVAGVREALVKAQQALAAGHNVIMDGRDAGTNILPNAECKIFLTASVEERARRRLGQQRRLGLHQDMAAVIEDIKNRDEQDANRKINPLRPAEDAIVLDCTSLDFNQTVNKVLEIIEETKKMVKK
jgi:cytidylate kinase